MAGCFASALQQNIRMSSSGTAAKVKREPITNDEVVPVFEPCLSPCCQSSTIPFTAVFVLNAVTHLDFNYFIF